MSRRIPRQPPEVLRAVLDCLPDCSGPLGYTIAELAECAGVTFEQATYATAILRRRGQWPLKPLGSQRAGRERADAAAPRPSEIRRLCRLVQDGWTATDPRRAWGVVRARTLAARGPARERGREGE